MLIKIKTSQIKDNLKVTSRCLVIVALVISMVYMAVGIFTNHGSNYQVFVYAQDSNESNEYISNVSGNLSKTNDTSMTQNPITTTVSPSKSNEKGFWINTMHLDGNTNLNVGTKCDTCPQNTPLHPAEKPPLNSTIPIGGGFKVTEPNKVGA